MNKGQSIFGLAGTGISLEQYQDALKFYFELLSDFTSLSEAGLQYPTKLLALLSCLIFTALMAKIGYEFIDKKNNG